VRNDSRRESRSRVQFRAGVEKVPAHRVPEPSHESTFIHEWWLGKGCGVGRVRVGV
jgi:hypothetical protein